MFDLNQNKKIMGFLTFFESINWQNMINPTFANLKKKECLKF